MFAGGLRLPHGTVLYWNYSVRNNWNFSSCSVWSSWLWHGDAVWNKTASPVQSFFWEQPFCIATRTENSYIIEYVIVCYFSGSCLQVRNHPSVFFSGLRPDTEYEVQAISHAGQETSPVISRLFRTSKFFEYEEKSEKLSVSGWLCLCRCSTNKYNSEHGDQDDDANSRTSSFGVWAADQWRL